ncbi:MAG: response regulator [Prochlorotrichaceae cyanobacterium]|jgi:CheY-like chemotaxis protein
MDSSVSSTASESSASEQGLSILIAEDVQVNQMVAVAILERLGYTADVVANGTQAVEAFQKQPYQLILMDICMPETDGLNATRQIRNLTTSETHPWIIALTAHAILGDREKCLAAGMNDYVTKPISVKTIAAAIDRYQQAISP